MRTQISRLDKYRGQDVLPLYTTSVSVTGGETGNALASGTARSDDGTLEVTMRMPEGLGGEGGGANPEQLFAAAYATCFLDSMKLLASKTRVDITGASATVTITFARDPVDGLFLLTAHVQACLPGLSQAAAQTLVRNTERVCPYTKMARQGIDNIVALAGGTGAAQ